MDKQNNLSKQSSQEEIKTYFDGILQVARSGNEFPINLDDVWPLVYSKKSDAVEALQRDFLQDIDFQVLRKNPQNLQGGRPSIDYSLSLSCMEFFIARKVRAVFEVYRNVFHNTVQMAQNVGAKDAKQIFDFMSHPNARTVPIKRKPAFSKTRVEGFDAYMTMIANRFSLDAVSQQRMVNQFAKENDLPLLEYTPSNGGRDSITNLLKAHGIEMSARQANKILSDNGILVQRTVTHKNGKVSSYYEVTEKGKTYGDNFQSEHNPKTTQPLWYTNKFDSLMPLF